jgi:hypothetical protein
MTGFDQRADHPRPGGAAEAAAAIGLGNGEADSDVSRDAGTREPDIRRSAAS